MQFLEYRIQLNSEHFEPDNRNYQRPIYTLIFMQAVQIGSLSADIPLHIHKIDEYCFGKARSRSEDIIFYDTSTPPTAGYFSMRGSYNRGLPDSKISLEDNEHGFMIRGTYNRNGRRFADRVLAPITAQFEALEIESTSRRVFPKRGGSRH